MAFRLLERFFPKARKSVSPSQVSTWLTRDAHLGRATRTYHQNNSVEKRALWVLRPEAMGNNNDSLQLGDSDYFFSPYFLGCHWSQN